MGRKRSGRQTGRKPTATSDPSDVDAQLEQQSRLIEQLTQQLNDAQQRLEQRDRQSAGGQPANPHSARILECLTTLLAAHEELQPRKTLQRIEDKIDDLRERDAVAAVESAPFAVAPFAVAKVATGKDVAADHSQPQSWEEIRANAISGFETPAEIKPGDETVNVADDLPLSLEGVLAPDPIDMDHADVDSLRKAVDRRDAYAVCLLHHIRVVERRKLITAEELSRMDAVPEQKKTAIAQLEARLQEVLRITEVELSLERARVSRDSVRLQHQQNLLSQQERLLNEQRESMDLPSIGTEKSNRKWLDALGFGKD